MEYTHTYLLLSYRPNGCMPIWHRKSLHSHNELLVIVISNI